MHVVYVLGLFFIFFNLFLAKGECANTTLTAVCWTDM